MVTATAPVTFVSLALGTLLKPMFDSSTPPPVPELSMTPLSNVKPATCAPPDAALTPLIPLPEVFRIFKKLNDGDFVKVKETP